MYTYTYFYVPICQYLLIFATKRNREEHGDCQNSIGHQFVQILFITKIKNFVIMFARTEKKTTVLFGRIRATYSGKKLILLI